MLPRKVVYWSNTFINKADEPVDAKCEEYLDKNLLDNPSNWIVCCERFELSLNGIPFFPESINSINLFNPGGGAGQNLTVPTSYSLMDLITNVNRVLAPHGDIEMLPDGRTQLTSAGPFEITLSERLNFIFGLSNSATAAAPVVSDAPRLDLGDELDHIVLKTTLPVVSDVAGQRFQRVLTDVSPIETVSMTSQLQNLGNVQAVSWNPRQQLIYAPHVRRFVNMKSGASINSIGVEAFYTDYQGETHPVKLKKGMKFSVKLGFYAIR